MDDKEEIFEHESYGMAAFSRVTGTMRLFGSAIKTHYNMVALRIKHAKRRHSLSQDWYYGDEPIVEVFFSAAQFAALLTTMNMGDGVPCTINSIGRKQMERVPDLETESEKVRSDFKLRMREMASLMKEDTKKLDELLKKKTLNKADRHQIGWLYKKIVQEVESNIPFVLDQFNEASEKTVSHAKAEVENFMTTVVQNAGLKALQAEFSAPQLEESNACKTCYNSDGNAPPYITSKTIECPDCKRTIRTGR